MGIVLILLCTLIGLILGSAWTGFIAGLVVVFLPLFLDETRRR